MKCLDTDLLAAVMRGWAEAEKEVQDLDREGRHSTTAINAFELFYGAYRSAQRRTNVDKTKMLLERLEILPFEEESAEGAGEILADLTKKGDSIDFRDAMIAGIARFNGLTLVTRNTRHFSRIKDLKLESW